MDVYKDECVAGMVTRKAINMHTQWTSVFLCFILSVSAAQLIHLQLSRLVEQVRGNVVLRRSLNPQSSSAGCAGSDQWSRVTRPGVSVSFALCCFVRVCVLWQTGWCSSSSVLLKPHAASWGQATCVYSVFETLWSQLHLLCRTNAVLCQAAAKNKIEFWFALHKVV